FQADYFDDTRTPFGFFCRGHAFGLAVLPLRGEGDFLQARQENGIKVIRHLHQDELAPPAVFAVQVDDGMAGGAGTGEVVEDNTLFIRPNRDDALQQAGWLWRSEIYI